MRHAERIAKLRRLCADQHFVSFQELSMRLSASRSSLRRDLLELEQIGLLRRVHGGAISLQCREDAAKPPQLPSGLQHEKSRIGKLASSIVEVGQTIIIGGGSTTLELARNLLGKQIQIVTNSIPIAQVFWDDPEVEVTLTGGQLYPRLGIQLGPICDRMISSVSADLLFLGARGIQSAGISVSNSIIVDSLRTMVNVAQKVVLLADHSKFGHSALIEFATLEEIDLVISDSAVSPEYQQILRNQGIQYMLA